MHRQREILGTTVRTRDLRPDARAVRRQLTRLGIVAAYALATTGCSAPLDLYTVAEDATAFETLVVVLFAEDGSVVGASGAFSSAGTEVPLIERFEPGREASIVTLAFDEIVIPVDLPTSPLQLSSGNSDRLPIATKQWERRLSETPWSEVTPTRLPLGASWLSQCPTLLEPDVRAYLDVRCIPTRCPDRLRQVGCEFQRVDKSCLLDNMDGVLDAAGQYVGDVQCSVGAGLTGAEFSLACEECDYDVYTAPEAVPFDVTIEAIYSVPLLPYGDRGAERRGGYLHGMVETGGRIIIAGHRGSNMVWPCDNTPSELVVVDPTRPEISVIDTATAPDCMFDLVAGDGAFYGLSGGNGAWLHRFSLTGELLQSNQISWAGRSNFGPVDLALVGTPPMLAASIADAELIAGQVSLHDPSTLRQLLQVDRVDIMPALASAGPDKMFIGGLDPHRIELVRLTDLGLVDQRLLTESSIDRGPHAFYFDPDTGDVVSMSVGRRPAVHVGTVVASGFNADLLSTTAYEVAFSPLSATPWPSEPGRVLMGGFDWTTLDAYVTRFEYGTRRFIPGVVSLGKGPATAALTSSQTGDAWFLMTKSGQLARVSEARPN